MSAGLVMIGGRLELERLSYDEYPTREQRQQQLLLFLDMDSTDLEQD